MDLSHGDGSVHFVLIGWEAELLANLLDGPEIALAVIINGNGE